MLNMSAMEDEIRRSIINDYLRAFLMETEKAFESRMSSASPIAKPPSPKRACPKPIKVAKKIDLPQTMSPEITSEVSQQTRNSIKAEPCRGELALEENPRVSPIKIRKPAIVHRAKPFGEHPLSLGFEFNAVQAAFNWKRNEMKLQLIRENAKKNSHLPLSCYIRKKPFFPNFVDPVPLNHKLVFPKPVPQLTQINEVSSSQEHVSPELNVSQIQDAGFEGEPDAHQDFLLLLYFGDLCPDLISSHPRKCLSNEQCGMSHELPDKLHVEQQLLKNSMKDSEEVYEFALMFPHALRKRYFPAFAGAFAERKQVKMLAKLIQDSQKINPFDGFEFIVNEMVSKSWSQCDALKFVIENHKDSPDARNSLLDLIASTGREVLQFVDYLQKIKN